MHSSTLEEFDPFDELDRQLSRNITWLSRPWPALLDIPVLPSVPQKYRITVDCAGFTPSSIKTELAKDNKAITVFGKEEMKEDQDNWCNKEFRKTYKLPNNIESSKMVSFMTLGDKLVVEFPLKGCNLNKKYFSQFFICNDFFLKLLKKKL